MYFVTFSSSYTRIYTLAYVGFVLIKELGVLVSVLFDLVCVLSLWGPVGCLRFELSYAKAATLLSQI